MPRTSTALAVLLTTATLVAPTGASAVGETCRGEAATIIGKRGTILRGTEGRDVVVTNNSQFVRTRGGDDLVCITGDSMPDTVSRGLNVTTGEGNDVVDATQTPRGWPVDLGLGPGADEFYGGQNSDLVGTGPKGETDRDLVHGGAAGDVLISRGGDDEVYGDRGGDSLHAPPLESGLRVLDGGHDLDTILLRIDEASWRVDLGTGATRDGAPSHAWSSIERLDASAVLGPLSVTGTPDGDQVDLYPLYGQRARLDMHTGGGDDLVRLYGAVAHRSEVALGAGTDRLRVDHTGDVTLDLSAGTFRAEGRASVRGVEDAAIHAATAHLTGSAKANHLRAGQCHTRIEGLAGDDEISWSISLAPRIPCDMAQDTFLDGGPGNDQLVGSWGPDVIDAGPGRDSVDGYKGRDVCTSAERRTSCEG